MVAACNLFAQGKVAEIREALMGARLTALLKPNGGVRGIETGCTVRRLVARTLAKQFVKAFEAECAPFQYALSTRAGTDCVGHMLRAAETDFGQTDFGQTDFGQFFDRLWPIVVLTDFGQTDFGHFFDRLWPILVF